MVMLVLSASSCILFLAGEVLRALDEVRRRPGLLVPKR